MVIVDKVMHLYHLDTQWTKCGRYVSIEEGSQDIYATDSEEEMTCKSCRRVMYKLVCR